MRAKKYTGNNTEQKRKTKLQELTPLVQRAREFDEDALEELCRMFYKNIYTYIYYRVPTIEDAEDLTHEVFVRMVDNIRKQHGQFKSWLYTIAKNLLKDYYRKKSIRSDQAVINKIKDEIKSTVDIENQELNRETIRIALKALSQLQQDVVVFKYILDHTNKEIAKIIKKSEGAVKVILHRAIKKMRSILEIEDVKK